MNIKLKKIDAIIVVALILVSGVFLSKAGYISLPLFESGGPSQEENVTTPPIKVPTPPVSFIPSFRKDVSPDDEGVHYAKIRTAREWWYFGAIFNDNNSELHNWTIAVSFNHMAHGDLLGTMKPDLLVVVLNGDNGESFGGMINKKRYFGILNTGTLIASSPGVNVQFEDSWAEGEYPNWHIHAEDNDIDKNHEIIIDLDYTTSSLPIWTIGTRAFDKSKSSIANYLFIGCKVSGTVEIDGEKFIVNGTGHHEHSWSPNAVSKGLINGWDWFHVTLDNGWNIYESNYYPTPQIISSKTSQINPFGTLLITTDCGESITELKNVDLKITGEDGSVFPFVKMPADFSINARPSLKPIHIVSQALLYGTNTKLELEAEVKNSCNKIWKFPTYVGMKIGSCEIKGTLSWSDEEGDHQMSIRGQGVSWSMRALL